MASRVGSRRSALRSTSTLPPVPSGSAPGQQVRSCWSAPRWGQRRYCTPRREPVCRPRPWSPSPRRPGSVPSRPLDRLWRSPVRRAALRAALGIRVAGPKRWNRPPHPVELAGTMGVPLLAVHGEDDPYFPSGDATALATAGGIGSLTWHRPAGFGHAEDGFTAGFARELAAAIVGAVGTGRFVAAAAPPE